MTNKNVAALKNMDGIFDKLVTYKKKNDHPAIEVKNLSFKIKKRLLLNKLNFTVKQGEIHGFIGPNGAGKTTTIKNIMNAYVTRNNDSLIKIFGFDCKTVDAMKHLAYIPEYASFPPHLNLFSYLIAMARFHDLDGPQAKKKAEELINILELKEHKHINPNLFSSGMKKKVLLAQALMSDPSVLILDEPAANLDPLARNMFFKSIKNLSKHGITIFISSHILAELEGLIDAMTMINLGNIVYSGTVKDMTKQIGKSQKMFSLNIYCSKSSILLIEKMCLKLKLKTIEEPLFVKVTSDDKKKLFKILELIAKDELDISSVSFDKITLQDIYNRKFGV